MITAPKKKRTVQPGDAFEDAPLFRRKSPSYSRIDPAVSPLEIESGFELVALIHSLTTNTFADTSERKSSYILV